MSKLTVSPENPSLSEFRSKLDLITDFLLHEIPGYVASVFASGDNAEVPDGYDTSGNNIQYKNQNGRVMSELANLKATLTQHFTQNYPDIAPNDKKRQEATTIGDLSNIYIDDRIEAIVLVHEACKNLLASCEKNLPLESYVEIIKEFKTKIQQFSTLWSLKRYLGKYSSQK